MVPLGDGVLAVYYAGSDTVMNVAFTHEDVLAAFCLDFPMDPLTGQTEYPLGS